MGQQEPRRLGCAWRNASLRTKGLVVIAVPVVGMLLATVCLFAVGIQGRHAADSVSHSLEVRTQIHELDANLVEVDAAVRGYLLDGQSQWLTRFERAKASSDELVGRLRSLIADNARQRGRLTLQDSPFDLDRVRA